jgi:transposase
MGDSNFAGGVIHSGNGRFAMAAAVRLRSDFRAIDLRRLARRSRNASQARRLLALAAIYEGAARSEAAKIGGVTLQIVRDWVLRFNAEGPDGLVDRKPPGAAAKLGEKQRRAVAAMIEAGPIPAAHGVVRWRLIDLVQWIWEEFRIAVSTATLSRELRAMGYRKLSARPRHHAQREGAIDAFKKSSQRAWRRSPTKRASQLTPSKSGSRTRRASARRTRSRGAGPCAEHDPLLPPISAPLRPTSSAPSVPATEKAPL